MKRLTAFLVGTLMVLVYKTALGDVHYIAPAGADSGTCIDKYNPCGTIQYAALQATYGDTIAARGGAYPTPIVNAVDTKNFKIRGAYQDAGYSLQDFSEAALSVLIIGQMTNPSIALFFSDCDGPDNTIGSLLEGFMFIGNSAFAAQFTGNQTDTISATVRNNVFQGVGGIIPAGSYADITNNTFLNMTMTSVNADYQSDSRADVHANWIGTAASNIPTIAVQSSVHPWTIFNNFFKNNYESIWTLNGGTSFIYNNTFVGDGTFTYPWGFSVDPGAHAHLYNNIFSGIPGPYAPGASCANICGCSNLFYGFSAPLNCSISPCPEDSSITCKPDLYLDPKLDAGSLLLTATSPCVDRGVNVGLAPYDLTDDAQGQARPKGKGFDLGADEYYRK